MRHNDDAFATMLLMSQINPFREELVRPLTSAEWHHLREAVGRSGLISMGALLRSDMSELVTALSCAEEEAYRLCVLLGRVLPLSVAMEQFQLQGVGLLTYDERLYPEKLRETLGAKAPPMLYVVGRPELLRQNALAVLGAPMARGDEGKSVRRWTRAACAEGYSIVTDAQTGAGRVAIDEAAACGGRVVLVLAGALFETLRDPLISGLIDDRRCAVISQVHPAAPYTPSHAQARNKCVYALSQAAFVFACEEEKGVVWAGAVEALRMKWGKFVYTSDSDLYPGNRALLRRGALVMPDTSPAAFPYLAENWSRARAEQLCLFDWAEPKR